MIEPSRTVSGKRFVPLLLIGFVVFTVLGLLATYGAATLINKAHPQKAIVKTK